MKKILTVTICAITLMFSFSACNNSNNEEVIDIPINLESSEDTEDVTDENADDETVNQTDSETDDAADNEIEDEVSVPTTFNKELAVFEFTDAEITAYEEFSKNHDKNAFKDMNPFSVFKIWIQFGIQIDWEADFEMYCKDENLTLTKEQFKSLNNVDKQTEESIADQGMEPLSRKEYASIAFANVLDGEFVETSDTEGHIFFLDNQGRDTWINFKQVTPGIWELVYYPISDPK